MSRPNKPLPVPALEGDLRQSGHQVVDDDDESASGSEEVVFLAPERKKSLSPGRSNALNASVDSIGPVRRNTAVSPRMQAVGGPLLGSARNSPLVKRKSKRQVDESPVTSPASSPRKTPPPPPGTKALKVLGMDDAPRSPDDEPLSPRKGASSPRPPEFLAAVAASKARTSGSEMPALARTRKGQSSSVSGDAPYIRKAASAMDVGAPRPVQISEPGADQYEPGDTVERLREKLDDQRQRYEAWKKEHLEDTKRKLSIMMEENKVLKAELADAVSQAEAWKTSYEAIKSHSARAQSLWDEERVKLVKRYNDDQKKIDKLQRQQKNKGKPQGMMQSTVVKSSIFGRGKPPVHEPSGVHALPDSKDAVAESKSKVGEPRLIKSSVERDSTPLAVPNTSSSASNRIRKCEEFELCSVLGQGGFGAVFLCRETATGLVCAVKRMSKATIVQKEQVHTVNVEVSVLKEARIEENQWIVQFHYAFQDDYYIYLAMEFCSGGDLRNLMDNVELEEDGVRLLLAEMIVAVSSLHDRGYVHRDLKPSNFLITGEGHLKLADFGLSKSGFKGVKKPVGDTKQIIRVFLVDGAYKTLMVNADTTISEVIKQLKIKLRLPKSAPWLVYECNTINGLERERPLAMDDKPVKVAEQWQEGLVYKYLFKEADALRVQHMTRTRVEQSHRDPFFQQQQRVNRRERLYSVVGSPHYMAAEILSGSGYDAVADWWSMGCILFEMLVGAPPFTGTSAEEVFKAVLNSKESLKFPSEGNQVSDEAKHLVHSFLSPPKERLGYNGVGEIKQHPFFAGLDWKSLHQMTPPFEPALDDELDCGYFEAATAEGIENMTMNDPTGTELLPPEDDPWGKKGEWDWSAIP